jgi:hypothetical protein
MKAERQQPPGAQEQQQVDPRHVACDRKGDKNRNVAERSQQRDYETCPYRPIPISPHGALRTIVSASPAKLKNARTAVLKEM